MRSEITPLEFGRLVALIGRPITDPAVQALFGESMQRLERDEVYSTISFPSDGVDVIFQEAPWVLREEEVKSPEELLLAAIHLHGGGAAGYGQYQGNLSGGIKFGASMEEIRRQLGSPGETGGGNVRTPLLDTPVPRWFKYPLPTDVEMHLQFDNDERLEMVTLQTPYKWWSLSGRSGDTGG